MMAKIVEKKEMSWSRRDTIFIIMLSFAVGLLGLVIFGPTPIWQKRMAECQDVKHGTWLRTEGVCIAVPIVQLSQ